MKKLWLLLLPIVFLLVAGVVQSRKRQHEEAYFVDKVLSVEGTVSADYFNYEGTGFLTVETSRGLLEMQNVKKTVFSDIDAASFWKIGDIDIICSDRPNVRIYGAFSLRKYIKMTLPELNVHGLGDVIRNYDVIYRALEADLEAGRNLAGTENAPGMICRGMRR